MLQQQTVPTLSRYHLLRELRRDAFGIVYQALDEDGTTPVLLRIISDTLVNSENFIVRFELLKSLLPSITHPNLLKILQLGVEEKIYFIAREMRAKTLDEENNSFTTLATFDEEFYPPSHRRGLALEKQDIYYFFGAFLYKTICGQNPHGVFPSVLDIDPALDPLWDEIIQRCLSTPHGSGYNKMQEVLDDLRKLAAKHQELPEEIRKVKQLKIPEGRAAFPPNEQRGNIGFRCVRSVEL